VLAWRMQAGRVQRYMCTGGASDPVVQRYMCTGGASDPVVQPVWSYSLGYLPLMASQYQGKHPEEWDQAGCTTGSLCSA
jgi:hypothetical protein